MAEAIPISSQQVSDNGEVELQFKDILGPIGCKTCKYERVRELGSGSFGKALLVRRVSDGQLLVAKRMDLAAMSEKDTKYATAEIQCLASCDHFAIIKYYEDYVAEPHMLIIMEFADAGDLNMQIKQRAKAGFIYFEEHEVGYTFVQLAMAVDHIHRRRMLHRDIKGANVMLMTNGVIKLGDFGFSHQYENTVSDQVAQTFCGTPYYLAPELWNHQRYSKKADVWAMGILLFEMMALRRPFVGQGMRALSEAVMSNRRDCELPQQYSRSLKDLCNIMLRTDPNQRPSCAQLFKLPHMMKLLLDFGTSVDNSQLVSDALKKKIHANICEIRDTSVNDPETFTFVGHVGTVSSSVFYEGYVRKESGKTWKERFLVLRDGGLVISRHKGDKETKPLPVTFINSAVFVPEQSACSTGVFAINLADTKTMWFQALPPETAEIWVHKIQQSIGVS
ncbi:serine/threonine-protein kinase [Leishmania donovani]|uniref:non-specific serine/threonine protein kinase n=3 Tax=Leishmania donovani species complex TaxID=38574 RepID=A0A6L0XND2_LEIIN|nr:putative serine/threonine-protein kinase a [Leishmania infantum JPCM5]TPP55489.1 Protein kinase domain family protein [Leishmania donovani]CAC9532938.1 serine/threonine-protein_kinase_a_-_putative [Leishmania infantum]CAJ1992194.1 serine/threonine-protein kinase [Leishmania donovani]CAM71362.1 putative serine/threonine-protein kinase a [Leishmania infantum JPCM5]SUZ45219.1 serine/threonine-protein_kinase_a_-_putative [Leishmania infantum]|eukprot:XP_001468279.1 putative serine/threonine-protein kinase a [Leishmania infantum JPCM5]